MNHLKGMKLKPIGLERYEWAEVEPYVGLKNMVQFVREENKKGSNGYAWKAVCKGKMIGWLPEQNTVREWDEPLADVVEAIRAECPAVVSTKIVAKDGHRLTLEVVSARHEEERTMA